MNEHQIAYLDALRSGDYDQTTGSPKSLGSYCCLGVAAELTGCLVDVPHGSRLIKTEYGTSAEQLPDWLNDLLDLTYADNQEMVNMNDSYPADFNDIANALENLWKTGSWEY